MNVTFFHVGKEGAESKGLVKRSSSHVVHFKCIQSHLSIIPQGSFKQLGRGWGSQEEKWSGMDREKVEKVEENGMVEANSKRIFKMEGEINSWWMLYSQIRLILRNALWLDLRSRSPFSLLICLFTSGSLHLLPSLLKHLLPPRPQMFACLTP